MIDFIRNLFATDFMPRGHRCQGCRGVLWGGEVLYALLAAGARADIIKSINLPGFLEMLDQHLAPAARAS